MEVTEEQVLNAPMIASRSASSTASDHRWRGGRIVCRADMARRFTDQPILVKVRLAVRRAGRTSPTSILGFRSTHWRRARPREAGIRAADIDSPR